MNYEEDFMENFLDDRQEESTSSSVGVEQRRQAVARDVQSANNKFLEEQKRVLECVETLSEAEPKPQRSLDFEEAFQKYGNGPSYESKFKTIPFLKEDVGIVNSMSHCSPDDIAKLIRSIQNSVYTLGVEEARQCRRGKILGVLKSEATNKTA